MRLKTPYLVILLSLLAWLPHLHAQPVIILTDSISLMNIGRKVDIYEDTSASLTFMDILRPEYQSRFRLSTMVVPNLGTTRSVLWCRLLLVNKSERQWYLRIYNAYLDTIQVYIQGDAGFKKQETGKNFSYDKREIKSANYIFHLPLQEDSLRYVYIRVRHHMIYVPLEIGQIRPILEEENIYNFFFGLFFGIVAIILMANFIMYYSIRDISLIWYMIYTAGFALYTFIQKGFFIQVMPDSLLWISQYSPLVIYTGTIFIQLFAISFLKARQLSPLFFKINIGLIVYMAITILIYITRHFALAYNLLSVYSIVTVIIMITFGGMIYKRGYKPARFLLIAYSFSIAAYGMIALQAAGIISPSFFSQNAIQFGTIWEIIFFTIAIGDKTYIIRKEKERAQKEALKTSLENENLLLNQTIILEQKVQDRTRELEKTQEQLITAARQAETEKIRRRISQDIHDDISSGLNKISWMSELAKIRAQKNKPDDIDPTLDKIIKASHETVDNLIEIIWSLNPNNDDLENLLIYMRNYTTRFFDETSFNVVINFPEHPDKRELNPELKRNLFLVMKEALHNAAKYSRASNIMLDFQHEDSTFIFTISDDGVGIAEGVVTGTGNGMVNMQKRMESVKGTFKLDSSPGKGTRVILEGVLF